MLAFEAIETRLNRAVVGKLANKLAVFGVVSVPVVFGRADMDMPPALGTRRMNEWKAGAPEEDFASLALAVGSTCTIDAVSYTVTEDPDTVHGWTTIKLRKA